MFNVHLRVNDAATGQATPVRLRICGPEGREYVPLGCATEFPFGRNEVVGGHVVIGRERFHYIDGSCEVPLPGGVPLTFQVAKGPEYAPLTQTITVGAGQMAVRITIARRADLRAEGWYSGDTRCHFLSPHAALLEAMGEDLAVVQLLVTESMVPAQDGVNYLTLANMPAFSGQAACLEKSGHAVAVNTFNTHQVLGSLALLHCHRAVFPLSFGGADATDDWSLADWCDQCHRKNGLVVWADPFRFESGVAPEALADLVASRIDAVECTPANAKLREWYRAWSAGIRFALAGASGKDSNRGVLGAMRTYAYLPPETPFSLANWIDAVRAGRTFVTTGPQVRFTVDDQPPGAVLKRDAGSPPLRIYASARHVPPESVLEVLINGDAVERISPDESGYAMVEFERQVGGPCWLAARCLALPTSTGFAHTSPVFVEFNHEFPADAAARKDLAKLLEGAIDWANAHGRFEIPRRKEALLAVLRHAVNELR